MKRIPICLLLVLMLTSFRPWGSGTAYLSCKSESGRTVFTAELQDITSMLEKAELIVDGKKVKFSEDDNAYTIFDAEEGVFTVILSGKPTDAFPNGRFIELWSIPKSFKIIKSQRADQKYEFKAKIEGTEPRKGKHLRIPQVILNCTLEYKI